MKPSALATARATVDLPAPAGPSIATTIRLHRGREVVGEPRIGDVGGLHAHDLHALAGGEAGDRAQQREAVIAVGLHPPAAQPARAAHHEAVVKASMSAPRPRRPSTTVAMRSDSLTRSSPAPRTTVSPSAKQPSRATSGSSSIASGTSSASTVVPSIGPEETSRSQTGSSAANAPGGLEIADHDRPHPLQRSRRNPVRVQLTPTPSSTSREPRHEHAGGDQKGAR